MLAGAFIIGGYVALIWVAGWWGVAAAALHLCVLLAGLPRR